MAHLESADLPVWAESQAGTVIFPDWDRHYFWPIQLYQLTSMARIFFIDDNVILLFFIVLIL